VLIVTSAPGPAKSGNLSPPAPRGSVGSGLPGWPVDPNFEADPLRIGLSCEATVDLTDPGELVPTTTAGSPLYETAIFTEEETGDHLFIDAVIAANLDPNLARFRFYPLENMPIERLELGSLIKEAIKENRRSPLAPPLPENMSKETIAPEIAPLVDEDEEQAIVERVTQLVEEILKDESVMNLQLQL